MILITSASGITGSAVLRALVDAGDEPVRTLTRSKESQLLLRELGATETIQGDIRSQTDLEQAMDGVRAVYHIGPRMQADEAEIGRKVIAAAQSCKIDYLVYQSVIHPHHFGVRVHTDKLDVEDALLHSGLKFACVRPTNLTQNVRWVWQEIVEEGVYRLPYSSDVRLTWIDVADVGACAAEIIRDDSYAGDAFTFAGPDGMLSRHDICDILSHVIGRTVTAERQDPDEYFSRPQYQARPRDEIERLKEMFASFDEIGLPYGNVHSARMILQREPISCEDSFSALHAAMNSTVES
jgi:uncharacterized protein YbjT (DUF2867 family)